KITYVADALGSDENIKKIAALAKGSDILYIEAYFLDKDSVKAKERYHLTAKEAGRIAREAGVGRLEVFHFSPKYTDLPEEIVKEAEREFKET
ncbi:MAG: ribonuclease Z, partial [Nitrospirota bacterium]